jgi:hypothetical protein
MPPAHGRGRPASTHARGGMQQIPAPQSVTWLCVTISSGGGGDGQQTTEIRDESPGGASHNHRLVRFASPRRSFVGGCVQFASRLAVNLLPIRVVSRSAWTRHPAAAGSGGKPIRWGPVLTKALVIRSKDKVHFYNRRCCSGCRSRVSGQARRSILNARAESPPRGQGDAAELDKAADF